MERTCLKAVAMTGVDLNYVLEHPHLAGPLQFVSGLGKKKADYLLERIRKENKNVISTRDELLTKFMEKVVFENCSGFLKVKNTKGTDFNIIANPLDATRIHPKRNTPFFLYKYSKKINLF
jgi:transcription elongation factor SPT6